jgi:hypothetical protein
MGDAPGKPAPAVLGSASTCNGRIGGCASLSHPASARVFSNGPLNDTWCTPDD